MQCFGSCMMFLMILAIPDLFFQLSLSFLCTLTLLISNLSVLHALLIFRYDLLCVSGLYGFIDLCQVFQFLFCLPSALQRGVQVQHFPLTASVFCSLASKQSSWSVAFKLTVVMFYVFLKGKVKKGDDVHNSSITAGSLSRYVFSIFTSEVLALSTFHLL